MNGEIVKKPLALVVDDSEMNREILTDMLEDEYDVVQAEDGKEALQVISERINDITVILLDLVMPEVGGVEVLKYMYERGWTERVPVLVISGETSIEIENECFDLGVFDFLHKPYEPVLVNLRIRNATTLMNYRNNLEEMVRQKTEELKQINEDIIELLGNVVEARSLESGQHVKRVKYFTRSLAGCIMQNYPEYNITSNWIDTVASASALHDVGKVMIADNILHKPGKLTDEEFAEMKNHSVYGCEILNNTPENWSREYFEVSYAICRHHHERFDGRGYPDGLSGNDIPLEAQIVSVADCFDALTTKRVYKDAFSVDKAYDMILGGDCGSFNPDIMDCFEKCRDEFEKMVAKNPSIVSG